MVRRLFVNSALVAALALVTACDRQPKSPEEIKIAKSHRVKLSELNYGDFFRYQGMLYFVTSPADAVSIRAKRSVFGHVSVFDVVSLSYRNPVIFLQDDPKTDKIRKEWLSRKPVQEAAAK